MSKPKTRALTLRPVDSDNWRDVRELQVTSEQRAFVAEPTYYLALCCFDDWNPLAIYLDDTVIGFMMWAIDDDASCWFGGIFFDRGSQLQGHGRKALIEAMAMLKEQTGSSEFALSYQPDNVVARHLYGSIGFEETGEVAEDEVVARLSS
jgi:diamine N-acetyltransferase